MVLLLLLGKILIDDVLDVEEVGPEDDKVTDLVLVMLGMVLPFAGFRR